MVYRNGGPQRADGDLRWQSVGLSFLPDEPKHTGDDSEKHERNHHNDAGDSLCRNTTVHALTGHIFFFKKLSVLTKSCLLVSLGEREVKAPSGESQKGGAQPGSH